MFRFRMKTRRHNVGESEKNGVSVYRIVSRFFLVYIMEQTPGEGQVIQYPFHIKTETRHVEGEEEVEEDDYRRA